MPVKSRFDKFSKIIEVYGLYLIGGLAFMFSLFISITSLFHTTEVKIIGPDNVIDNIVYHIMESTERAVYYNDNFFLNLIVLIISLFICFLAASRIKGIKLWVNVLFIFAWTFTLGTIWVLSSQSAPAADSGTVTSASWAFAQNDLSFHENDRYFRNYSFQLGYVLFNEVLIRIAELKKPLENLMFLEVINAFFLSVINVFILLINNKLFKDERVNNITTLLLSLSVAPIIFCNFVYGIFPGMMFAIIALYCEICYLQNSKAVFAFLSVLSITMAVMIKSNYIIWLIAMTAICIVKLWSRKKYVFDCLFIGSAVILSMCVQPAVKSFYEKRIGEDLGDSIPYVSWIAMGLNESAYAPGWYNYSFTLTNFENSNFNADEASKRSKEQIKDRIKYFRENPQYANDFFYMKVVSQWNDPSYQSIWNNVILWQYKDKGKIAGWVCNEGEARTRKYMDYFAQLVFFSFFIGCIFILKKRKFMYATFPLVFIGGFMYQFVSEGKSQYIMPYFILMSGFAAFGIVCLYDKFAVKAANGGVLSKIFGLKSGIDSQDNDEEEADSQSEKTVKKDTKEKSDDNSEETSVERFDKGSGATDKNNSKKNNKSHKKRGSKR